MSRMNAGSAFGLGLLAILLAACGGGGGGSSQVAGIERLGVSVGTVSGFGSIVVNGKHIGTNNADILIDDSPGTEADLEVGDVVIVSFDPDASNLNAKTIFSNEAVEGPIDSIDLPASTLQIAGQQVSVDADTSFDDSLGATTLAGLAPGQLVEVSGLFNANGEIQATRIEAGMAGKVEVHGTVSNLDAVSRTFIIGSLVIDFGTVPAVIDNAFPGSTFNNGDFVEVKGSQFGGSGELLATRIEPDAPGVGADTRINTGEVEEIEIEGFITRFVDASDFDVTDIPVTTSTQTRFVFADGSPAAAADLGLNIKLEVEGSVNSAGVLMASTVEVRRASAVRIAGLVDAVDSPNKLVTVLGIVVRVDNGTRVEDKSQGLEPFGVSNIAVGDYLEIRGSEDLSGAGEVLATRLEREDIPQPPGSETELQGFVQTVAQPDFTILGVTVTTDGGTIFRDTDGTPFPDANAFFAQLNPGELVKVDGNEDLGSNNITATEVQMEN